MDVWMSMYAFFLIVKNKEKKLEIGGKYVYKTKYSEIYKSIKTFLNGVN